MKEKAIFVTGGTGFVGSNIVEKIAETEKKVPIFVLIRSNHFSASERMSRIMPNFKGLVIEGDVCMPGLGINKKDKCLLSNYDVEVWHAAGSISFDDLEAELTFLINVGGTQNVLSFMKEMGFSTLHYVSTAYVAGDRRQLKGKNKIAYEYEDDIGQNFHNPYEESKLRAEMLVKKLTNEFGLKTNIYRIGVAVGDSKTGKATSFSGYYAYMQRFKALRDKFFQNGKISSPVKIIIPSEATVNISCIDYLIQIMLRLAREPASVGKVFNVVNPNPPRTAWLVEKSMQCLGLGIDRVEVLTEANGCQQSELEVKINRMLSYYQDYTKINLRFDSTNVKSVLGELPEHPQVNEKLIYKLLTYAFSKNFGKPKFEKLVSKNLVP